jgi:phage I-like protein
MTTVAGGMVALQADAGTNGEWVHLVPAGTFMGRDGRGPYRLADPAAVIEASRRQAGQREIPVDYEHQIDFAAKNGQPAPAAGWIKGLQARADGIWGLVDWTPKAALHIAEREYRYISPVITTKRDGPVSTITGLLRAALVNTPNLDQLTALAKAESTMDDGLQELRQLLGLADDADAAAITAKVREVLSSQHTAKADPAAYVPIGAFERVLAEVNRLSQGITLQAAEQHVADQIKAGNMPPFLKDWGVDLCTSNKPAFDALIGRTKGAFNGLLRTIVPGVPPGDATRPGALTESELAICANMGLTEAEFMSARPSSQSTKA